MPNNTQPITWKQIGIIIMMLTFMLAGFGYVNTKADKKDVNKRIEYVETRTEDRINNVQAMLKDDVKRLEGKLDKVYDLLLKIKDEE